MEARTGKRIATGRLLDPARGRAVAAGALMFAAVIAFREGEAPWT